MWKRLLAALLVLAALAGRPAWADEAWRSSLRVDWPADAAVTGGAAALWSASLLLQGQLAPPRCRWCEPPGLDRSVRDALVWPDRRAAADLSDAAAMLLVAGVGLHDLLAARAAGRVDDVAEDALLIGEAAAVTGLLTEATKDLAARERPYARFGYDTTRADHASFASAHTSVAFAVAASGGMVAQLRGYPGWPWVYGVGFTAAAATGYLRLAADQHWLTDVLAGAALGTAVGLAVPWLHRDRPLPGGLTLGLTPHALVVAGRF